MGRPVSAVDTGNSINYVTSATYAPQGALAGADYGSNITFSANYNNRLLPWNLQGSTISPSTTFFELEPAYNYNGTVSGVTNALTSGRTQSFTYDYLNRIVTGHSTATSGPYGWGQSIPTDGTGYDRYGNLLKINSTQCSTPGLNLSVSTYNQISGYSYDASGNMTADGSNSYTWNAESLMTAAGSVSYTYDGDGKRVEKSSGTYYWFSPAGIPLAETDSSGNTQNEYIYFNAGRTARRDSSGNVYYYFGDHLGTARLLTNASGTVCYDADFTPFGYEMAYTTTCSQNYKFAGMERDSETGNDHTLFRNYEQNLGRCMSPDSLAGDVTNPQSLNRYAYALNNPTTLTDPLGLTPRLPCPMVDTLAPPGCENGDANYGTGYTVDGAEVMPSMGQALLGGGFGVQCPDNYCGVRNIGGVLSGFVSYLTGSTYFPLAGPGSLFDTNDQALAAGAMYAENQSLLNNGNEQCGMTYGVGDQSSYTTSVEGTKSTCQPLDAEGKIPNDGLAAGGYHSHGTYDPNYYNERFSGQIGVPGDDIGWATRTRYPYSLATPGGRVIIYYPRSFCQTFLIGSPFGTGTTIPTCP